MSDPLDFLRARNVTPPVITDTTMAYVTVICALVVLACLVWTVKMWRGGGR